MNNYALYTHKGGDHKNCDRLLVRETQNGLFAVLCDGLNGMPLGEEAANFCADSAITLLTEGENPAEALTHTEEKYAEEQKRCIELSHAATTMCAVRIQGGIAEYASVGDSRIYCFSGGALAAHSSDDSFAYGDYKNGKCTYTDIRFHSYRSKLSACTGDGSMHVFKNNTFDMKDAGALMVCSDGFWEYVYETEMELDLCKSKTAQEWLEHMLLRVSHRSMFNGDNLSVFAYINKGAEENGF